MQAGLIAMSIMVTEVYEALVSAGADEDKAKAAAAAILVGERIATKQDIGNVGKEIADVKAELKQDIADVKAELKQDIAELKQDIAVLKFAVFTFGPVIIGLLIKLVFFP